MSPPAVSATAIEPCLSSLDDDTILAQRHGYMHCLWFRPAGEPALRAMSRLRIVGAQSPRLRRAGIGQRGSPQPRGRSRRVPTRLSKPEEQGSCRATRRPIAHKRRRRMEVPHQNERPCWRPLRRDRLQRRWQRLSPHVRAVERAQEAGVSQGRRIALVVTRTTRTRDPGLTRGLTSLVTILPADLPFTKHRRRPPKRGPLRGHRGWHSHKQAAMTSRGSGW
jgi:hypothetical protein